MKKTKKHHLMSDKKLIKKICGYADIKKTDTILEIGAGTGNLTEFLSDAGGFVYAIEKDRDFYSILKKRFSDTENIELINADILKIDLPEFNKLVSNLPYNISRKITEKILMEKFQLGILVYQREFAEKLLSRPYSRIYRYISALTQSLADVEILDEIPPYAFNPMPRVFSVIVRIIPKNVHIEGYVNFLHSVFNQRNKRIKNLFRFKGEVPEHLQKRRSFELTPTELMKLYSSLS